MKKQMNKNKIISIILKIFAIIIILMGVYGYSDLGLWKQHISDFDYYYRIILIISVLGFSGTLYGIATIIDTKDKK